MGRIRTLKPEFLRHESLQDLGPIPMLVFAGLWCQADREGRFAWKPRLLKLDILPFLDFDMGAVLDQLSAGDFIRRYQAAGQTYGYIPSWRKHQVINNRETASILPDPSASITDGSCVDDASSDACGTRHELAQGEGKGRGKEEEGNDACSTREDDPPLLPEQVAKEVMVQLGISGTFVMAALTDVLRVEMKQGKSPEELLAQMVASRREHDANVSRLKRPVRAEEFFGQRHWCDVALWPWKDGYAPNAALKSRRYITEEVPA